MNKTNNLPKYSLRFFLRYCHQDYLEDIEGDLTERFTGRLEEEGIKAAKWRFIKDVVCFSGWGLLGRWQEIID